MGAAVLDEAKLIAQIEALCCNDVGRGSGPLIDACHGNLYRVARQLGASPRAEVVLLTGFFLPNYGVAETDGPPGAVLLAATLQRLAYRVRLATSPSCFPVVEACAAASPEALRIESIDAAAPTVSRWRAADTRYVLAIEVPGPSADGRARSMRGQPLPADAPWEEVYTAGPWRCLAIGDGGNELGMGSLAQLTRAHIPHGDRIACRVPAEQPIICAVSNWGAAGLAAALLLHLGKPGLIAELLSAAVLRRLLEAALAAGAVDGCSGRAELTVDTLDWDQQAAFHRKLLEVSPC